MPKFGLSVNPVIVAVPKPLRAVIDTSVWIALLRAGDLYSVLVPMLKQGRLLFVVSEELENEIFGVAARPKHRRAIDLEEFRRFWQTLYATRMLRKVEVGPAPRVCADPEDDFLFAICRDAVPSVRMLASNETAVLNVQDAKAFEHLYFWSVKLFRVWCQRPTVLPSFKKNATAKVTTAAPAKRGKRSR